MVLKYEDLKILAYLRENSRETLTKLSRKTNIPVSTIFDKLKGKFSDVVTKNACLIDFEKIGFGSRTKAVIKVSPDDRERLKAFLGKSHHINSLYKINNGYDFMIDAVFKTTRDLEYFFENLESEYDLVELQKFYVIDELEREKFLSDSRMIHLLDIV